MQGRFGMVVLDWFAAVQGTECFDQLAKMDSNTHGLETPNRENPLERTFPFAPAIRSIGSRASAIARQL